MLENWLKPLPEGAVADWTSSKYQLGKKIKSFEDELPDLAKIKIAIVGIGTEEANAIRKALYPLSFSFGRLKIADLGNTRKEAPSFVIPLLKELLESKIFPIIIGNHSNLVISQFQAHQASQKGISWINIDEKIAFHPRMDSLENYLNPILKGEASSLFNFSTIACQSHYLHDATLKDLEDKYYESHRLGKVRADLEAMEPIIRDADMVNFNLSTLRQSEAPGVSNPSPSGLFLEEACQLSRYAGMSDKLTSMGFYGFQKQLDRDNQTAQATAQLIWYFLDGFYHRKNDFPASMNSLVEYVVNFKKHDYQLTFWKSNKSGRWWLQVQVKTKREHRRHRLIPCSYQDYLQACNGEMPERLMRLYEKFSV